LFLNLFLNPFFNVFNYKIPFEPFLQRLKRKYERCFLLVLIARSDKIKGMGAVCLKVIANRLQTAFWGYILINLISLKKGELVIATVRGNSKKRIGALPFESFVGDTFLGEQFCQHQSDSTASAGKYTGSVSLYYSKCGFGNFFCGHKATPSRKEAPAGHGIKRFIGYCHF